MSKLLAKIIKDAVTSKSYSMGSREALKSVKGSKLIVCSRSLPAEERKQIEQAATSAKVPVYNYDETSVGLGKLCSRQFRVSVIAINSASDSEIATLLGEVNK